MIQRKSLTHLLSGLVASLFISGICPTYAKELCSEPISVDFSPPSDAVSLRILSDEEGCIAEEPSGLDALFAHARTIVREQKKGVFFFVKHGVDKAHYATISDIISKAPEKSGFLIYNGAETVMVYMTN